MHDSDNAHAGAEIKLFPQVTPSGRPWLAMARDLVDHEVVGADARTPQPAVKTRHAWQPMVVWLWMLREAAHKERKRMINGQVVYLRRGQLAVSERYLAEKANWGRKAVRVFLERLEAFEMVTVSAHGAFDQLSLNFSVPSIPGTKKGPTLSVITICNYDKFQTSAPPRGPARAQEGPSRGPGGAQNLTIIQGVQENKVVRLASAAEEGSQPSAYATMVETMAKWLSPMSPDLEAGERVISRHVALYGMSVARDALADVCAQIDSGDPIGKTFKVFTKACQRIQARGSTNQSTSYRNDKAERAKRFRREAFGEDEGSNG